jgi:hypothetical protein
MVDFVKLGPLFLRVLVLLGFVGLMSQSLLIYFLQPLPTVPVSPPESAGRSDPGPPDPPGK